MKLLALFILILLLSCSETKKADNDLFIVHPYLSESKTSLDPNEPPPPPPRLNYTNFNFLVDSLGDLYYFQSEDYGMICGTGTDENTPPDFIDLRPFEIVAIPPEGLEAFVKLNIPSYSKEPIVTIGMLRDTIRSANLSKLVAVLMNDNLRWYIRKATDEEKIVLGYKKRQEPYSPDEIKWDSTKIIFTSKQTVKFIPPIEK